MNFFVKIIHDILVVVFKAGATLRESEGEFAEVVFWAMYYCCMIFVSYL